MSSRLTIKHITKLLPPNIELVKGKDYFYFVFDDGVRFETHSVMVRFINQLTKEQWLKECARAFPHNNITE